MKDGDPVVRIHHNLPVQRVGVDVIVTKPELVELRTLLDASGSLTVIESGVNGDPTFLRAYYLHSLAKGARRGAHAHRSISQLMIAISGSFDVELEHGRERYEFHLSSPVQGLLIPPLTWRNLGNFSANSVCLVLASGLYDETEYIRDYKEFRKLLGLS